MSMLVTLVTAMFFVTYLMFACEKILILPNLIVIKITECSRVPDYVQQSGGNKIDCQLLTNLSMILQLTCSRGMRNQRLSPYVIGNSLFRSYWQRFTFFAISDKDPMWDILIPMIVRKDS